MTQHSPPTESSAAQALAALGHTKRLGLFRLLVRAGDQGLIVRDLQRLLGLPASTLAHHLSTLTQANLVRQERRGREVYCTANYAAMHALVGYLTDQCCLGIGVVDENDAA